MHVHAGFARAMMCLEWCCTAQCRSRAVIAADHLLCISASTKDNFLPDQAVLVYRDNVEDALEKLQAAVDGAVESIQPIEVDPEKQKQMNKQ